MVYINDPYILIQRFSNWKGLSHYVLNNCATGSPVNDKVEFRNFLNLKLCPRKYNRFRNPVKFLPEYLKDAGYMNYHVGKWHLGYCSWSHTPTRRGFDRSYGSFGGGMQ